MAEKSNRAVFQLDVRIRDIDPPVWRQLMVWEDTKLPQLHRILQTIFEWEGYHLHSFFCGTEEYSIPDPDEPGNTKILDERNVPLKRLVRRAGEKLVYAYDFGDGWEHDLVLEAIVPPEPDTFYPRCTGGARKGPPEDCGGPFGYMEYLEALASRRHPQHKDMMQWRGPWDSEAFSVREANAELKRAFYRRPPVKRRAEGAPGC